MRSVLLGLLDEERIGPFHNFRPSHVRRLVQSPVHIERSPGTLPGGTLPGGTVQGVRYAGWWPRMALPRRCNVGRMGPALGPGMTRRPLGAWLARSVLGWAVAAAVLCVVEVGVRAGVPVEDRPDLLDRFALADVGAGAYVHRRDATAGAWLEAVGDRVRTRLERRPEGISAVDVSRQPRPGVPRIVVFGGSTTRGVPFDHIGGGFVSRLRAPRSGTWEIINLGVPGMDARGVAALAREARVLEADLYVVYTGNNEVVGDLLDHCVRPGRVWVSRTLDHLVFYRVLRQSLLGPPRAAGSADARAAQERCMGERVAHAWASGRARTEGPLDPARPTGIQSPAPRHDLASGAVTARLTAALDGVARHAFHAGVPVLLVQPPVNLRHAPERPLGAPGSSADVAREVDAWIARAPTAGLDAWTAALRVDSHRADALHGWGMARLARRGPDAATVRALRAAVDHDYQARRPTEAVVEQVSAACARWSHVDCVDAAGALAVQAGSPVLPEAWFADHCHPSKAGNERIAAVVSESIAVRLAHSAP